MSKLIIGLMGSARSGKDTIADYLVSNYGFQKIAFADSLKEACRNIFGFSFDQLHGNKKEEIDPFWGKSAREVLQFVGTDLFRRQFDDRIWVKSVGIKIARTKYDKIVISDCRFKNEKEAVELWGGEVWRIVRLGEFEGPGGLINHTSEVELQSIPLDAFAEVISKPTGIEGLYEATEEVLKKEKFSKILF